MGRLSKFDTEVKVEIVQHGRQSTAHTSSPSPLSSSYLSGTIYDSYNGGYGFEKIPSSPENDLNAYPTEYSPETSASAKPPKEFTCINELTDDTYLRPPLWEDITSSIQNIDPENAIMLGSIATQVKMESNDAEHFMEPLSTSPLLSPLEIKTEMKALHRLHSLNSHMPAMQSQQAPHMAHHPLHSHPHHQNPHDMQQQGMPMHLMAANCSTAMHVHNDDNNNSAYNPMCGNQYDVGHLDNTNFNFSTNSGADPSAGIMPIHAQQHHQLLPSSAPLHESQHLMHHQQPHGGGQQSMQQNPNNASTFYYNWPLNQSSQVLASPNSVL